MYAHAQAPVRIGLAGGGTDLPAWTKERDGLCLSIGVAMYCHAVAITRPDKSVVASYRKLDVANAATEIANGLIRESALLHGWDDGFEVHTMSEVSSAGSGLGVSSSIAVCLAAVFAQMTRMTHGKTTHAKWMDGGEVGFKNACAEDAWIVEIERLRRPIGRQDHMAAAHGGLRLYGFHDDEATIERTFTEADASWVAERLLLVPLPTGHDSRAILSGVKRAEQMQLAYDAVPIAAQAIALRDTEKLAQAVAMTQTAKARIPGAVPPDLADLIASVSRCTNARGVKVTGAGGGGHLVVVTDERAATAQAITETTGLGCLPVTPDFAGVRSDGWKQ